MIQRFRIGNNLSVVWLLYETDGNIHNLEGKEIELYMACGGYKYPVTDYTVTENAVAWAFPAAMQTKTGYYKLVLLERDAVRGIYSFDVSEAFCLEPKDALTNIETIVDEDATVQVRSVLTYAHITNLASVDTVQTEDGYDAVIRLTNGKSFVLPLGGGGGIATNIVDNLNSYSREDALSANQGRILKGLIDAIPSLNVEDNLTSVSKTNPLSANMGRELKRLIDSIDTGGGGGGGSYTLPIAGVGSSGNLGGIRVGSGLSIDASTGVLSVTGGGGGGGSTEVAKTMYSAEEDPGTPDTDAGSWHPARQSADIWMAISFKSGDSWTPWDLIYIGEIVVPYATFVAFAFTRSNAASVAAPTGGSYTSPTPTTTGWEDGIPSGDAALWMSTRTFASDDTHSDEYWSTPRIVADNYDFMDYEFSSVANPGTPSKANPSANETNPNWTNTATTSTIWMAMRRCSGGEYEAGSSWMVVKIKGEDGKDGTSVAIKGSVSSVGDLPSSDNEEGDGYILSTNGHLYVWDGDSWVDCGQIKGDDGADGLTTYLHIKYSNDGGLHFTSNDGEDPGDYIGLLADYEPDDSDDPTDYEWKYWRGEDGFGYEYIFKLTTNGTAPSLPSTSVDSDGDVPTGWTDDPGGVTAEYPYCWVAWRKKASGHWGDWLGTTNNKARLYAHYGADGEDGFPGQAQFKSIVFKRSATQPDRPDNDIVKFSGASISSVGTPNPHYGGTFDDPVPYGWSDGVPSLTALSDPDSLVNTLWMTSRIFTDDAQSPQEANWKTPTQAMDNDNWDFEYAYQQTNDARPADPTTANRHGGLSTQIWFDPYLDRYTTGTTPRDFTEMYWMAMQKKVNGVGVGPWTVMRIKGEKGADGVDGKDAKPVRIRRWVDVAGQTLEGNQKVFSGYEDGAPFRDVLILTKSDYPNGIQYPWTENGNDLPVLVTINYNQSSYSDGYPGSYFTNSRLPQSGNYSNNLPASATASATATAGGIIWSLFTNLGAVYIQLLVATQAYIGGLTVDHLTTNAGNNSYIEIDDGFICFYDSSGNLRIKMGQETGDSSPVLKFFDTDGETLLYNLGPDGIMQMDSAFAAQRFNAVRFWRFNSLSVNDKIACATSGSYPSGTIYSQGEMFWFQYFDAMRVTWLTASQSLVQYRDPDTGQYGSSTSKYNSLHFTNVDFSYSSAPDGYYVVAPELWTPGATLGAKAAALRITTVGGVKKYYYGEIDLTSIDQAGISGTVSAMSINTLFQ